MSINQGKTLQPARFGPYWRSDTPDVVRQIVKSNEIWGQTPRNIFQSSFPKVKAFEGQLPLGTNGVEFWTDVAPDPNGIPGKPTWSGPSSASWHKIPVVVTKAIPKI